jgi:hypothetical protein
MAPRLELQALLKTFGTTNVYFDPPANFQMQYPCIFYIRDDVDLRHAGNHPYSKLPRYSITVAGLDPDEVDAIADKVLGLPSASFDRHFVADNLHHDVLNLFF